MTVGKPIETNGMTLRQADELTQRLRFTIAEMLGNTSQHGLQPDSGSAAKVSSA
jgi:hypothetical protein